MGADELAIGELIVRSFKKLKSPMAEFQGESSNFVGFVYVYYILTRIHQCINGEETIVGVMKHKKDLATLKILEDESITIYTFSVEVPSHFGGNVEACHATVKMLSLIYGRLDGRALRPGKPISSSARSQAFYSSIV